MISEGFDKICEIYSIQKEFEYETVQFEYNMASKKVYLSISDCLILPKRYETLEQLEQLYRSIL